jgi:predicted DNA-binding transcriptional regulator YafY
MPYPKKEKQTYRLLSIVKMLYSTKLLYTKELAEQFQVNRRTIQRDMQTIASLFPLLKSRGQYSLDRTKLPHYSKSFHTLLLGAFADNIEIETLCLDKSNLDTKQITFAIEYRRLPKQLGENIVQALKALKRCSFTYVKEQGSSQREVDPIKLYTENSRWYLIARDYKDDKVKSFNLSKIKAFQILNSPTTLTSAMRAEAESMKSIWASGSVKGQKVVLYVKPNVAEYINDIKLHKTQEIVDRHHDGGLEVHCSITHKLEILPAIKSWLPYVHIIEPKWLREELMRDLEYYKDEDLKMDI